jgi:hypothetical protein
VTADKSVGGAFQTENLKGDDRRTGDGHALAGPDQPATVVLDVEDRQLIGVLTGRYEPFTSRRDREVPWVSAHDIDRAARLKVAARGLNREDRQRVVSPVGEVASAA